MSRVPAVLCAALLAALAVGAGALHHVPRPTPTPADAAAERARLTAWPQPARMPGFGEAGTLGPSQIADLTEYVLALAGAPSDPAAVARAVPLWQQNCAACHGLGGEGTQMLGTPDLTRGQFRYATGAEAIRQQIWHGADGRGPLRLSATRTPAAPARPPG